MTRALARPKVAHGATAEQIARGPGRPDSGLHIAIIDDDATVRATLGGLMRAFDHQITPFSSGDAFLASADRGAFDGVIADIQMPGIDGFGLTRLLSTSPKPLPVILITARPDADFDDAARAAGAAVLLRKPFGQDALFDQVARCFA
jgi:FixJ family two-component response regulator